MNSLMTSSAPCAYLPIRGDVAGYRQQFPVLVIDDDWFFRELMTRQLQGAGFEVEYAANVAAAQLLLAHQDFRLIVCDYRMPEISGIDFCKQLRETESHYHYLLLITGDATADNVVEGLQSGADDYLNKSFHKAELLARVDCGVRILLAQQQLERQQRELLYRVQHDTLTGLYNRTYLNEVVPKLLAEARRYQYSVSVLLVDLDHFKQVNDQCGHDRGDEVLRIAAHAMLTTLRETDLAVRFGGEEFLLLLPHTRQMQAATVAEKLRHYLAQLPSLQLSAQYRVTASIGVTQWQAGESFDACIKRADGLMYQSKAAGRNRLTVG